MSELAISSSARRPGLRVARMWAALAAQAAAGRDRWILWLPAAMGAGVAVYFLLRAEPPAWIGAVGLGGAAACAILLRREHAAAFFASMVAAAFFLGLASAQWRTHSVAAPVIERELGPVAVTGTVTKLEHRPVNGGGIMYRRGGVKMYQGPRR